MKRVGRGEKRVSHFDFKPDGKQPFERHLGVNRSSWMIPNYIYKPRVTSRTQNALLLPKYVSVQVNNNNNNNNIAATGTISKLFRNI
jgi:hypothetical protein